ncbi:MAG TPA: methyltransferase domain-containing protein, partial [Thermodesulfobacteriota bacterium]|nr:methyltransferase domain-containing protein [Thermodesulfobacteriota bacterium]
MPSVRRRPRPFAAVLLLQGLLVAAAPAFAGEAEAPPLDVPYVSTPQPVVEKMLEMARVTKDDVVYDLGSGDGRIVITAAKKYGARGVGVDIDPERIRESNENARKAGVEHLVRFVQQNLFDTDLREATVVTMYLLQAVNLRLRPRLLAQLDPGDRIVSHAFDLGDWRPDRTAEVETGDGRRVYVYAWVVPANVGGDWELTFRDGDAERRLRLAFEQRFQRVRGQAQLDGRAVRVESVRLTGDRIAFAVRDDAGGRPRTLRFVGRVEGDRMVAAVPGERNGPPRSGRGGPPVA